MFSAADLARSSLVLVACCLAAARHEPATVRAEPPPLRCAVEEKPRRVLAREFCQAVGRTLARPVIVVDDVRAHVRGDGVQVLYDDVQWFVVWLVDGRVRSFTRVSHLEAQASQLRFLVRATQALARENDTAARTCVLLDPNGGRRMRSMDLTYPWAVLRSCEHRNVEVIDPWWTPPHSAG